MTNSFVVGAVQHDILQFLTWQRVSRGVLGHLKGNLDLLVSYYSFDDTYHGYLVLVATLAAWRFEQETLRALGSGLK